MTTNSEDSLGRLAAAVDAWTGQAMASRRTLAWQLNRACGRLERLVQHAAADTAHAHWTEQVQRLCRQIAERDRRIADMETTVIALQRELKGLREAVRASKHARQDYVTDMEGLRAKFAQAREELARREAEIGQLRRELEEHGRFGAEPGEGETALQSEVAALRAELAARDAAHAAAEQDAGELARRLREAESAGPQLEAALRDRDEAHREIVALRRQLREVRGDAPLDSEDIPAFDGRGHKRRIGDILVDLGVLDASQVDAVLRRQEPGRRFGDIAVALGLANAELVARVIAAQLRVPFVTLDGVEIEPGVLALLDAGAARKNWCVPLARVDDNLRIAMANPLDLIAIENVEIATNLRADPVVATPDDVADAIARLYGAG